MKVQKVKVSGGSQDFWLVLGEDFMPIQEIDAYLRYLHSIGKSPNTVRSYAFHLKEFWLFLSQSNIQWSDVGLKQMSQFISFLKKGRCDNVELLRQSQSIRTERTINTIVTAVTAFYDYHSRVSNVDAIDNKSVTNYKGKTYKPFLHHISKSDSTVRNILKLKEPKKRPNILTFEQVKKLISAAKSLRDKFLLMMLYETGMRIGECLGLRHEDIKSWDKTIVVKPRSDNTNGARAKSYESRTIDVSSDLMGLYTDYVVNEFGDIDSDYVFINIWGKDIGKPLAYSTVYTKFRRLSEKHEIPFSPHIFRHTHATELLRSGWDASYVQKRLGHKDVQTTINTYAHLTDADLKHAFNKFNKGDSL